MQRLRKKELSLIDFEKISLAFYNWDKRLPQLVEPILKIQYYTNYNDFIYEMFNLGLIQDGEYSDLPDIKEMTANCMEVDMDVQINSGSTLEDIGKQNKPTYIRTVGCFKHFEQLSDKMEYFNKLMGDQEDLTDSQFTALKHDANNRKRSICIPLAKDEPLDTYGPLPSTYDKYQTKKLDK